MAYKKCEIEEIGWNVRNIKWQQNIIQFINGILLRYFWLGIKFHSQILGRMLKLNNSFFKSTV